MQTHEIEATRDTLRNRKRDANADGIVADRLWSIVERIEQLEEERKAIASDIKDIYAEAKSAGFDVKVLRRLIADRAKDAEDVDVYWRAFGE